MYHADSIIIGGGIAGLQAAIQLGRYNHKVLVIDSEEGRSVITRGYHNVLGWPDGISGPELRKLGRQQAEKYHIQFIKDRAVSADKTEEGFAIQTSSGKSYYSKTVFLATGITDNLPNIEGLAPCLGQSVYICPDCDGYEVSGQRTAVFGSGNSGAGMALTLAYWSDHIVYINHTKEIISDKLLAKLAEQNIPVIHQEVTKILTDEPGSICGLELENGEKVPCDRGFTGFKGNKVNNQLAVMLGVDYNETGHVLVNPRTKETNISGVWSGGDLTAHSEQVTISMGDGSQAAIWMHKRLIGKA